MKLCVSITEETTAAALARMAGLLPHADLFEVRADFLRDLDLAALLRGRRRPLLFTCRTQAEGGRWPDGERERLHLLLAEALELGFDLVDVEARAGFSDLLKARGGRGLVLSWHDFDGTPGDLDAVYERMAACRPEVVKIAARARGIHDLGRLLAFARRHAGAAGGDAPALVVVAMGPFGTASRILGAREAAPFTFAATAFGGEAGPGQLPAAVLDRVYRVRSLGAATRVYGVLGTDVLRSLSPAIH
ncbi:MAG TPA: type I 3-dehydroquinate dehydratase, partial [Vicinamibacteria bacterium]|nr:type I 3-dehydroquinate dehydratase [Vicinamibacteria bacterium]